MSPTHWSVTDRGRATRVAGVGGTLTAATAQLADAKITATGTTTPRARIVDIYVKICVTPDEQSRVIAGFLPYAGGRAIMCRR